MWSRDGSLFVTGPDEADAGSLAPIGTPIFIHPARVTSLALGPAEILHNLFLSGQDSLVSWEYR